MRPHEIEAWALRIVDAVRRRERVEDQRVELKAEWPPPDRAARQLAGHANAAHAENILWLIGVDETRGVLGAPPEEPANWYPKVEAWFDGLAPSLAHITVPTNEKTIIALLFETNRAPFVVRNPVYGTKGGGNVEREVPWREAARTRSARREDLMRLLVPAATLPQVEVLRGSAILSPRPLPDEKYPEPPLPGPPTAYLDLDLYFVPRSRDPIVIPFHRCEASLSFAQSAASITFKRLRLQPANVYVFATEAARSLADSLTIDGTSAELVIRGPGQAELHAEARLESLPEASGEARAIVLLSVAGSQAPIILDLTIPQSGAHVGSEVLSWRHSSK